MKKRVRLLALCTALIVSGSAFAQQYPSKPVRVVVPFPPGGVTDIAGRLIAQKLSERLGHQFYIENISGAGGNIGMANAARSPGDGYTILLTSSSIVVNPSLYNKVPYDVDKDFIPVTKAGATPNSWVVNSNFPVQTMKELIDLIKREPGKHSVGSPGTGWYGSLCPANRIRAGRARRIMRDTRRMVGSCTERQWADANPKRCRCSFHSSGSRVSSMRRRAVSSGGCLPLRIALTISGARSVRRKSRVA